MNPTTLKYYTGIGSRTTPDHILVLFEKIGKSLALQGYTLRSGGAKGADSAFESGCNSVSGTKEIFLPFPKFNRNPSTLSLDSLHNEEAATLIAKFFHPYWHNLSPVARKLHTRNTYQILGQDLNTPTSFVLCYSKVINNLPQGGTAQALRIAESMNIKILNFYYFDYPDESPTLQSNFSDLLNNLTN